MPSTDEMPARWLAIESSTDTLSLAVGRPGEVLAHEVGPGSAQASATLIPRLQALLDGLGWSLSSLEGVVFGRGPGAFTGLRAACAVAQGLAYGVRHARCPEGLPVLGLASTLALADEALACRSPDSPPPTWVLSVLDARMGERYVALHRVLPEGVSGALQAQACTEPVLLAPQRIPGWLASVGPGVGTDPAQGVLWVAGHGEDVHTEAWAGFHAEAVPAMPTASALLRLAPAHWAAEATPAREARPLYVRDKVALTTVEREAGARLVPAS